MQNKNSKLNAKYNVYKEKEKEFFTNVYFKDKGIDYQLTEDEWCAWDATSKGFNYEYKGREFSHKFFNEDYNKRPIIEVKKFETLMDEFKKTGQKPILIFSFQNLKEGKIEAYTSWNILNFPKDKLQIKMVNCPVSECSPELGMTFKPCYFLEDKYFTEGKNKKTIFINNDDDKTQGEQDWDNLQEFWKNK